MSKNRRQDKYLYIAATVDKFEYIIDYFYSVSDFADWAGVCTDTIYHCIREHRLLKKMHCYCEKVNLKEPEPEPELLDFDNEFDDF